MSSKCLPSIDHKLEPIKTRRKKTDYSWESVSMDRYSAIDELCWELARVAG